MLRLRVQQRVAGMRRIMCACNADTSIQDRWIAGGLVVQFIEAVDIDEPLFGEPLTHIVDIESQLA